MAYSIIPVIAFLLRAVTGNALIGKELQRMSCPMTSRIDIMRVISNTYLFCPHYPEKMLDISNDWRTHQM
jgi:hypothetical protein